jgi:Ras-related protein Rab-2A
MGDYDFLFKFVVLGDVQVGKSNLLIQFTDHTFRNQYEMTIGVEFGSKIVTMGDRKVKLQVWDTAGQESFRSITRSYYRAAVAAMLVFDVTRRESFEHLSTWLSETANYPMMTIVLVGNKADLDSQREVSQAEAEQYAEARGLPYLETSAKAGLNVDKCFEDITARVLTNIDAHVYDLTSTEIGIKVGARQRN